MRRLLFLLSIPILCSCVRPDMPGGKDSEVKAETIRILAIGNSFSADAVEQYLWELFNAAGIPAVIGNMSAPGSDLSYHWNRYLSGTAEYHYFKRSRRMHLKQEGKTFLECLSDEKWDVISLQQASGVSGMYDTFFPYLPDLMAVVGDLTEAEIVFHQTWAYPANSTQTAFANYDNDQGTMYEAIVDAVSRAVTECGIQTVIPVGTAVQNARVFGFGDTLNRDGLHLELTYGRFLAACVWYEILSGKNVEENPYHPASISEKTAVLCRQAAHQACLHPYGITPIN